MKLTFIGHAGFLIEHNNTLMIMDPWLSKRGAYDSAWLQFPCNHHLEKLILEKLKNFDNTYIYISHEHKDHFDVEFLSILLKEKPNAVFLIPNFRSKIFLRELESLRPHRIIELSNNENYKAHEIDVHLFMDESGINHDSGILVKAGGNSFLNLNDCKIFDRCQYIKNKFGTIDVFTVQFSGASWHPICYEMAEDEYKVVSKKKKLSKYRAVLNALKILLPNRYLPTAGPPVLLDPMHYKINFQKDSVFPQQFDVIKFLSSFDLACHIDSIMPGDVYCFEVGRYLTLAAERVTEENFKSFIELYAKKTKYLFEENEKYKPENIYDLFLSYFSILQVKAKMFSINEIIQHHLYFGINELRDQYVSIDLNKQTCTVTNKLPEHDYYLTSYPAWQIRRLVEGKIKGEDIALTFRGRMKRSPDVYNTWISCFLNSEPGNLIDNIKLIEAIRENEERIVVSCNGKRYQIRRYCPHQGADLQYGWCEDNDWVCPKHRWRYNLEDGGICESANACIDAVKLTD